MCLLWGERLRSWREFPLLLITARGDYGSSASVQKHEVEHFKAFRTRRMAAIVHSRAARRPTIARRPPAAGGGPPRSGTDARCICAYGHGTRKQRPFIHRPAPLRLMRGRPVRAPDWPPSHCDEALRSEQGPVRHTPCDGPSYSERTMPQASKHWRPPAHTLGGAGPCGGAHGPQTGLSRSLRRHHPPGARPSSVAHSRQCGTQRRTQGVLAGARASS
jgi:hypothetical protein